MANQMPRSDNFTVGPVILSYTDSLFEARAVNQGDEPKFGCNVLYDDAVAAQIHAEVERIGRQAFPTEWDVPNRCHKPIRGIAEKPGYGNRAKYFSNISAKFQPKVVGPDQQPVINVIDPMTQRKPVYGGCVAYVNINVYSYRHPQGGPGVSLGVAAVMKVGDGEPLNERGEVDIQKAFAGVPVSPPQGAQAPAGGQFGAPVAQAPQGGYAAPAPQQAPQGQPTFGALQGAPQGGYAAPAPQGQPNFGAPQGGYAAPAPQQAPQGQPNFGAPQGGQHPVTGAPIPPVGYPQQ